MALLSFALALGGDLEPFLKRLEGATVGAVRSVLRKQGGKARRQLQGQLRAAGLGRLDKTIRLRIEPTGARGLPSDLEGHVFSSARVPREGGRVDLLAVYAFGTVIRPTHGKFLAVPSYFAPRGARSRPLAPEEAGQGRFILLPNRSGNGARLVFRDATNKVAYWLVREVRVKPQVRLDQAAAAATQGTGALMAVELERRLEDRGLALDVVGRL